MDSILWQVLNVLLHETFVFDLFHIVYTITGYTFFTEYTLELFEIVVAW